MKILFVCTGNICRSPTAEAMFLAQLAKLDATSQSHIYCDSAGTHGYHIGESPDARTITAARKRGVDMTKLVARKVSPEDYEIFDVILAMDATHLAWLHHNAPANSKAFIAMYLEYAGITHTQDVPDPYYAGAEQFETVLNLIIEASEKIIVNCART
ncbi:MAG: low molecular weight phosphotyrosine protein phosphatase [Alphaproteobacteria bacterium]|nr:low molecular weight phosphotyrosine protein phosphatase [Alphaproteobacteria bacterium]